MSHKVNPFLRRLGIIFDWKSSWLYNYKKNIKIDYLIRNFINKRKYNYYISNIYIEHINNKINIIIFTSRPAIIIGKNGVEILYIKKCINKIFNNKYNILLSIKEILNNDLDALLISKNIALQIKKGNSYKKVIKHMISFLYKKNINGIKIKISGRLNGIDMARSEFFQKGNIKLSTLRANIDYGFHELCTKYGIISIKVWIMKEELIKI
ncbi:MAG: 30S ribosomal protein S3 [Candidatus Shikimatogenerans sp. Tcar]|uniref:Small ribosomal subunit protein uS3 n=1 Tax=Candidatus Shikimatogenerans sp. Tcar TaxID=3158565 RepID=A0AAU7QSD2_9FLAO